MIRAIDLTWPGGEHAFLLRLEHLRAIQDKCDAGPGFVLTRLTEGTWRLDDVIQPLRLGLEGGGMARDAATRLVLDRLEEAPGDCVLTAKLLMQAALFGVPDDPVGDTKPGEPPAGE